MTSKQITMAQCAALSGLGSNEMVLGVTPTAMHDSLHASYLLHPGRGWEAVRDMIVADIRASLDVGASKQAADLLIVLRRFLSERLGATFVRYSHGPAEILFSVFRAIRLRNVSAQRNSLKGVASLAKPPARRNSPARLRKVKCLLPSARRPYRTHIGRAAMPNHPREEDMIMSLNR